MRQVFQRFPSQVFPYGEANALRNKISSFQQLADESIPEAWERCKTTSLHAIGIS